MRILVVDDHQELLSEIENFLVSAGYDVTAATSAEQAIKIVESDRDYELVVTDISMPGMNGIEMWDNMSRLLPGTKVIFISSTNNNFLQQYLPGAFLPKPFRLEHLHQTIEKVAVAAA